MANTNRFVGLHRGPIDHQASSVINAIVNTDIDMGSVVDLVAAIPPGENLPRISTSITVGNIRAYGIAVGGDADGVYGDGSAAVDDSTKATTAAGQGIVVVTQGRCLARVSGSNGGIVAGERLAQSATPGVLQLAGIGHFVVARALNVVAPADTDMIAVDVQREDRAS